MRLKWPTLAGREKMWIMMMLGLQLTTGETGEWLHSLGLTELKQELETQNVAAFDDAKFSDAILMIDTFECTETQVCMQKSQ